MIQIDDLDSPITAAQKIIHGTKTVEMTPARTLGTIIATGKAPEGKEYEEDMFSDEDIMEIVDYLLVYCKHHGGDDHDSK